MTRPNDIDTLIGDLECNHLAIDRPVSIYSRAIDALKLLQKKLDTAQSIASNGWVEAWHCGNGFMALPRNEAVASALQSWQESQTRRAIQNLNAGK